MKKTTALTIRKDIEKAAPLGTNRDFLKLIAHDVGRSMAEYIEIMYPDAVEAATSTFLLAVTNHVHNEIMALADFKGGMAEMLDRISERKKFRRQQIAFYRALRREKNGTPRLRPEIEI